MADAGAAPPTFPAPGSAVPGAPPPLKRALTPADGVPVATLDPPDAPGVDAVSGVPVAAVGGSRFTTAAALVGIAVGLELAGALSRVFGTSRRQKH